MSNLTLRPIFAGLLVLLQLTAQAAEFSSAEGKSSVGTGGDPEKARPLPAPKSGFAASSADAKFALSAAEAAFGAPLKCVPDASSSVHKVARKLNGFAPSDADTKWALATMAQMGYPSKPLPTGLAREAGMRTAALLRRGNLVAAKMANDEASGSVPGYGNSQFAVNFELLLTIATQPVLHATYPGSVRAKGEAWPADARHEHTHGVDVEQTSASLAEIINRASVARKGLGELYNLPVVRYYLLASGFRDDVALKASGAGVCELELSAGALEKLNVAARFMAMPSRVSDGANK